MNVSVDYLAYLQAEIEEMHRIADLYIGKETDTGEANEHIVLDHLKVLLASNMTRELRSVHLDSYFDIRAALRSLAMIGLDRSDFYEFASQVALSDAEFMSNILTRYSLVTSIASVGVSEESREKLESLEKEYISRKNQSRDRLVSELGLTGESSISDKDVVRMTLREERGVNTRGLKETKRGSE